MRLLTVVFISNTCDKKQPVPGQKVKKQLNFAKYF